MTGNVLINDEIALSYHQGFEEMAAHELARVPVVDCSGSWGVHDKNRHMVFSVFWREPTGLVERLTSTQSLAKREERALSRRYRNDKYHCDSFFETRLAGIEAQGFLYWRNVDGADLKAETIVFKHSAKLYRIYSYTRLDFAEPNRQVLGEILASMHLATGTTRPAYSA